MSRCIFLIFVLVVSLSLNVFAEEWVAYQSPLYGFQVEYPDSWQAKEISGIVAFFSPPEGPDDRFSENINIAVEDVSAYNLDSERYATLADQHWLAADTALKVLDFKKTNINR
jgi:hypothetical protein